MLFRSLTFAAALAALAACEAEPDPAQVNAASETGWSIEANGDLNEFFDCLENAGATLVSAHRGGPARGYPENALETFAHTLEQAPALLEVDVATSADGVLYLMHDDTLERTTTGAGPAKALPWADISELKLRDGGGSATDFTPARFDAVLAWAAGRTILEIDIKPSTTYETVAEEIRREGAEARVILIAYSLAQAKKLHRLLPETMISLNLESMSDLNRAVAAGVPADRLLGFTGTGAPRPQLFSTLDSRDVEVIYGALGRGGVDAEAARAGDGRPYTELAAAGVDVIATDRPIEAVAALAAAGRGAAPGECGVAKS